MKVNFRDGDAVGFGFCGGNTVIDRLGVPANFLRHRQLIQNPLHIGRGCVVVLMMMSLVFVILVIVMVVFVFVVVVKHIFMIVAMCISVNVFPPMELVMNIAAGQIHGFFHLPADIDFHVCADNAAGLFFLSGNADAFYQMVHGFQKTGLIRQKFIKSGQQHISGGSHLAFQIKRFHSLIPSI
ncbi:hypothetical protein SDC9_84651 [bioreactor metagenome]|uniref:Uncharacterized protein n=1 Tax=bioreactor metagenome TaxID=1076179 RepID=A0A644ZCK4_9ZZZZ